VENTVKYTCALMVVLLLSLPGLLFGQTLRDRVVENHYSYVPSGQGRFQTLVAIPGCSGISSDNPTVEESNAQLREDDLLFRRHYRYMAEKLQAKGFAVLLVNIHAAEGLLTACADPIDGERIAEYINEAVAWARELPFVDPDKLHIIGWSMGGGGVLKWLDGPRSEAASVRSAIAVYPPCNRHKNLSISMPVLILLGGSDDIADPIICENLVGSVATGQRIAVENYPGARHGFDIEDAPPMLDIGDGMTVGYQKEAADASWVAILQFLAMSD
jgi:dienelactone hydrolase